MLKHLKKDDADIVDLCDRLGKNGIEYTRSTDMGDHNVDCLIFLKSYKGGKCIASLLYVTGVSDVVDVNGRTQYHGTVASMELAMDHNNELVECDEASVSSFNDANYLGMWLLVCATNEDANLNNGSRDYENIKSLLMQGCD